MKKYISLFVLLGLGASACLDEDPLFDPAKVNNVIEFYDLQNPASATTAPYRLYVNSYAISTAEQHTVQISYSGAHSNNSDITVELAVSPQALDEYNEFLVESGVAAGDTLADGSPDMSHIPQYLLMPASFYTVPSMTVTIPKGETKANIVFTVNTTLFDFAKAYALPLRIVSTSSGVISGNYGAALYNIGAKNAYHGNYHSFGTRWNFANYAAWNGLCCPPTGFLNTGPWDFNTQVLTVDEFTSTIHAANSDGGFGTINITVNPATNVVTVAPNASTALNGLIPMQPSAGKTSTYDPVTKTFQLYYQYQNLPVGTGSFRALEHTAVSID